MTDPQTIVGLTWGKVSTLFALGGGTVLASQIGDPSLEKYVQLGVGGVLAYAIFYFYRQLQNEFNKSKDATAEAYRLQAMHMITTLQESARVNAQLCAAVSELRTTVNDLNHEQRERYENDLRDGGRRAYDPTRIPKQGV